jgi:hypothetical protein
MVKHKEAYFGYGSTMLQSSILIHVQSSAYWEKIREKAGGLFS